MRVLLNMSLKAGLQGQNWWSKGIHALWACGACKYEMIFREEKTRHALCTPSGRVQRFSESLMSIWLCAG